MGSPAGDELKAYGSETTPVVETVSEKKPEVASEEVTDKEAT